MDIPGETIGSYVHSFFLGKYNKMNREKREIKYVNKLRLSGAYFILAEAYCRDSQTNDLEAVKIMNIFLEQRNATLLEETIKGDKLLQLILLEKWKEFVGEGIRYLDLKRFRKTILLNWNTNAAKEFKIDKDDYRWNFPIPEAEYIHNDLVLQNKGWETTNK